MAGSPDWLRNSIGENHADEVWGALKRFLITTEQMWGKMVFETDKKMFHTVFKTCSASVLKVSIRKRSERKSLVTHPVAHGGSKRGSEPVGAPVK